MAQAVLSGAKVRPFFFGGLGATNVGEVRTVILGQTRTTATWAASLETRRRSSGISEAVVLPHRSRLWLIVPFQSLGE